jgi:molybdopterin/thiamine biosynthesis adenylyltransferase/rhodanese-related sulfurtransferase
MMPGVGPQEIDAEAARAAVLSGALLIDVREPGECALAPITDAIALPLSRLDTAPAILHERSRPLVLVCAMGVRSRLAAERLVELGYADVSSVVGGRIAWEGLAGTNGIDDGLDDWERQRYARHLVLPEVGASGQRRLREASVLLVGAGGLGSPVALYLAAAGVGRIRIVDPDRVETSNLQRQVLHGDADVGALKVRSAAAAIHAINPRVEVESIHEAMGADNVGRLLASVHVAIDGSDNFAAREALNIACVAAGVPMVSAAIERFRGQLSVWWPAAPGNPAAPCWACAFPTPEGAIDPPNCAAAGVLGVMPGILGTLQACEVLKLLLGVGEPLIGRMLLVDALGPRFREITVPPDPECRVCGGKARTTIAR